jgi:hypothetical protein
MKRSRVGIKVRVLFSAAVIVGSAPFPLNAQCAGVVCSVKPERGLNETLVQVPGIGDLEVRTLISHARIPGCFFEVKGRVCLSFSFSLFGEIAPSILVSARSSEAERSVVSLAFGDETSEPPVDDSMLEEYPERQELWRTLRDISGYLLARDTVAQTVRDQKDERSAKAVQSKVNRILTDIHEGRYKPLMPGR